MRITVRTAGLLGKHLPPGSQNNQAEIEVGEGATAADVMTKLGVPVEGSYLISLNGQAVPKAARETAILHDKDTLAIMPPLKGG